MQNTQFLPLLIFLLFFSQAKHTLYSIFENIMTQKAYRYRFYPTLEQISFLAKTFGCCRFIYNYFLAKKQSHYEEHKKTLSYTECSRKLAELKMTKEWLKEVSSVALQQSLRHLEAAFERFFQKKGAFPKFKKRCY
jgi:putative transposase